ncbi:MAG: glycosyltransferase family 4 protein [Minisyncoccota bacterium]
MNLLILTQKVDRMDPVLGFFHRWIEEFAKHCEQVTVIALGVGEYELPKNVRVFSLGKSSQGLPVPGGEQLQKIRYVARFYRLMWRERKNYDGVFVHMNQVYVLLGGIFWKIVYKPVGFWYVHRAKTFSLWIAEKFVDVIFTSLKNSFTLVTKKSIYLGHGVDIVTSIRPHEYLKKRKGNALLCVGRITPIKDQKTIIRACGILARGGIDVMCTFVGGIAASGDGTYFSELHDLTKKEGIEEKVFFKGSMPQRELPAYYWQSGIHINACPTGGLDKVVIEGMLGGAIPVVANEAFRDTLGEYADRLIFREGDAENLAQRIKDLVGAEDQEKIRYVLEKKARGAFDLSVLVKKIINWYETSL